MDGFFCIKKCRIAWKLIVEDVEWGIFYKNGDGGLDLVLGWMDGGL